MTAGLQVWDASGNLTVDTGTKTGRILGTFTLDSGSAATGSYSNSRLNEGTPWFYSIASVPAAYFAYEVDLYFSGTSIYWAWPTTNRNETFVIYGVF